MLIGLDIENIAVIERASIEFENGLNVVTGETGAGKTLLINSLNMVLGGRTAKDLIREGTDFARVSAVFFCNGIDSILEENNIPTDDGNVIISRKLYRDGRNICHINSIAVNVSLLRTIGERLVVIHGQRDSGEIIDTSTHIHFLDEFSKNSNLLDEYKVIYKELKDTENALNKLNDDFISRQNEIDYLKYQTTEIESASLSPDEEEVLLERKKLLENAEAISLHSEKAYSLLATGGAKDLLYDAMRELERLSGIDADAESYHSKAADLYYEVEELSRDVSSYLSRMEFSPYELRDVNDRLDIINTLKRKYNGEISDILEFYETATKRLSLLLSYDENKAELEEKHQKLLMKIEGAAERLSLSRHKNAQILSEKLAFELSQLDMSGCRVEFSFSPIPYGENGNEAVELLISTDPMQSPKPIAKIASGGEISRVMLAIKSVFSDFDKIPTLLFDEIDTGVSGRAAEKIANKMKSLSKSYQLICVTHLPVIASSGTHHLLIEKNMTDSGFKTTIRALNENERISEIARIISGDNINEISLKNASQMLGLVQ
ncbi:MAG: DNA repair protein RecN [Clostridia bacterium]|nr:DNA repair protein RecN [Clostridia bacterium]